jgi:hypothetical protein
MVGRGVDLNAELRIERVKTRQIRLQADRELVLQLLSNPLVLGFGGLVANHALYKSGWYKADVKIPGGFLGMFGTSPEMSAVNMHDSIALFIMACSIASALKPGATLGNAAKTLAA